MKIRSDFIDITGLCYGEWTVLRHSHSKDRKHHWICECSCGTIKTVRGDILKRDSKSCGCLKKRLLKERVTKHRSSGTKLHQRWISLRQRCRNPNSQRYDNYGGRGIKVCTEWDEFKTFKEWALSNGYEDYLTIDRIDVDGDYCPDNVRFVSNEVQQLNKTNNRIVTIDCVSMTVKEWCDKYKVDRNTFNWRLYNGWVGKSFLK